MKDIIKVTSIADKPTEKGNLVLTCSLTRGLMTENNYFLKSVPEVIKAAGIKVGDNITEQLGSYKIEPSVVQDANDPEKEITFYWIKPA